MNYPRQYNAVSDFIDCHVANGLADKAAFIDPDTSISYGELARNTHKVANLLAACGLEPESRITLLAHDTVHWPAIFWGAIRAGVVPAALNTLLGTEQYRYILADCRARARRSVTARRPRPSRRSSGPSPTSGIAARSRLRRGSTRSP